MNLFCKLKKYFDNLTIKFSKAHIKIKKEGYIEINKNSLVDLPEFLNLRILNKVIMSLGCSIYPLRTKTLLRVSKIISDDSFTVLSVGGCLIKNNRSKILVLREFNKIKDYKLKIFSGESAIWDKKYLITNLSIIKIIY